MRKELCSSLAVAVAALIAQPAAATPLLEIVTTPDTVSRWADSHALPLGDAHDVSETEGLTGWYFANLRATADVDLTYTYVGKEAGWTNYVDVGGSTIFRTDTTTSGASAGGSALAGDWVDFTLGVLSGGNEGDSVVNGSNVPPIQETGAEYGELNFWLGYTPDLENSVYVAFDDGGGGAWEEDLNDDNHDDLVFRIDAVAVPEPGTLSLLGFGLLAAGFAARRRNPLARS